MIKNTSRLKNYPLFSKIAPKEEASDPLFQTKDNVGKIYILRKSIEVINKNGGAEMWCAGTPVIIIDNDFEQKTIDVTAANGTHIVIDLNDKRYKGCFWPNNVLEIPSNTFLLLNAFTNPALLSSIPALGIPLIFLSLIMCASSYISFWVYGLILIVTLLGTVGFIASNKNKWHDFAKFRYKKQNLKELKILFERFEQLKENKKVTFNKETRQAVYDKYDGHCAYCGKKIAYKDMQVDHLVAKRNWNCDIPDEEIECFENYMPACRRCNHYKRAHTLEDFREMIETIPDKLFKSNYIFKVGVDYGFFVPDTRKIVFYFERIETEN